MGRQVNFYLSDRDQEALLRRLKEKFDIQAIMGVVKSPSAEPRDPVCFAHWKPGEYPAMIFRSFEWQELKYEYVGGVVNGYFVDYDRSPAIEFFRCITRRNKIAQGRFYVVPYYYDPGGVRVDKSAYFLKFAQQLFVQVKKFCPGRQSYAYVGPEVEEMRKSDFRLVEALTGDD